ncbi:MAG: TerC family protein [Hyphomonas sp.]|uniref:TerC family protein n=1 Tax=Hyphomonas sp. TaxID=87 RepID=UPI003528314E
MTELLSSPAFWGSLATLTFLEIVLGIDNLLFVSIATGKLEGRQKVTATRVGVWGAMVLRIGMLGLIFWILQLDKSALFHLPHVLAVAFSGGSEEAMHHIEEVTLKDLILFAGGLFLLWKGTQEIHSAVEGTHHEETVAAGSFTSVIIQLFVINIVFSLDSVITAVGMTDDIVVMITAVILSTFVMAVAADPLAKFIADHPTTKMLALAFILLVGVALVADGLGFHIPRGYLYFAIAFSLGVELLNIRARNSAPKGH